MYHIRGFRNDDLEFALANTAREGWDCTAALFRVCLQHDPAGCFVAECDGRTAAMITTTRFHKSAWIGNLIVSPDQRRRGLGRRMMEYVIARLSADGVRTFHLEADPPGVGIYRRLGFVERFESLRFRKSPPHASVVMPGIKVPLPLSTTQLADLCCLDALAVADDRRGLLEYFLSQSLAVYAVGNQRRLDGFSMVWPSAFGVRFGPCIAIDLPTAEILLAAALADFADRTVILGVPGSNRAAAALFESRGFEPTPSCLRMTLGSLPADDPNMIFAIANGCLG